MIFGKHKDIYSGVHFLENHDEKRALAAFGHSVPKVKMAAVITYTLPGITIF